MKLIHFGKWEGHRGSANNSKICSHGICGEKLVKRFILEYSREFVLNWKQVNCKKCLLKKETSS